MAGTQEMTSGSQKVPALNPNCMLCLEHLQEQREKQLHQGGRCKIKHSILDLQTHPPTWQSSHWACFWEGGLFYLLSWVSLRKSQKKSNKYWTRQGVACHGLWAKQHCTLPHSDGLLFFFSSMKLWMLWLSSLILNRRVKSISPPVH